MNPYSSSAITHNKAALLAMLLAVTWLPAAAQEGGIENLRETGRAFSSVASEVSPSVVFIQVEKSAASPQNRMQPEGQMPFPFGDEFFERFFGQPLPGGPGDPQQGQPLIGQGSGFLFEESDGKTYILTNSHVVADADKIQVRFQDGREFDARITGSDPQSDVAVIEIDATGLNPLPLADSARLQVGEWVLAIGNPFGLNHTLTVGVVSATGRTSLGITDYEDFIQTDAAINPGNSGGPLVNLSGEVVGINTAIFSRSGGYMGVGFAIPINLAGLIAEQLIQEGVVTRGYLGIIIQDLTSDLAQSFGLEGERGVVVAQVSEGSPADEAGLQQGDVIVGFNGEPVTEVGDFRNRVSLTEPGSRQGLTILRGGERRQIDVTIGNMSEAGAIAGAQEPRQTGRLGMTVQELTPEIAQQLNVDPDQGVVVTQVEPGSAAAQAGIRPGAVILEVNRDPVSNTREFSRAVGEADEDERILLLVRQGEAQRYVAIG